MPWSITAAETAGGVAGFAAGKVAGEVVKAVCESVDMPKPVTAILKAVATGVTHWGASQATKAAISGTTLDGVGLIAGVITSPITAFGHASRAFYLEITT